MMGLPTTMSLLLLAMLLAATSGQVNVQFPGGSVDVKKDATGTKVDVQHPAGSVNVDKGRTGPAAVNVNSGVRSSGSGQNDLLAVVLKAILGFRASAPVAEQRAVASTVKASSSSPAKDVHVDYPGGLVNVRQATPGGRKVVDVAYPGGSVNVGGNGNNVDVAFPGGFVKLDPSEPGKRRTGVVVFPFGSVRFG